MIIKAKVKSSPTANSNNNGNQYFSINQFSAVGRNSIAKSENWLREQNEKSKATRR